MNPPALRIRHILAIIAFCLATVSQAHVVQQLFAEVKDGGPDWELEVLFDAGYAKPEWRGDPDSPQPTRDWLVSLGSDEHSELCAEAAAYLSECLSFESNGKPINIRKRFIDFDQSPPDFPASLNDGAYFRVQLSPEVPDSWSRVDCRLAGGDRPNFAIKTRFKDDKEAMFLELRPGESFILFQGEEPPQVSSSEYHVREESVYVYSLKQGYLHVIPKGLDHILFILALFLLQRSWKPLLWQSLAFTVAHTLTLGLTAAGIVAPKTSGIEALIALSIAVLALENLFQKDCTPWRLIMVFGFGLIHGMGFANALSPVLAPGDGFLGRLIITNIGVELAQITILGTAWLLTMKWHETPRYKTIRIALNILIAVIAAFWLIERFSSG